MKKLILFSALIFILIEFNPIWAQVQVDRQIQLTGTGTDGSVTGIKSVANAQDAASAEAIQKGLMVYNLSAGSGNNFTITVTPAISAYQAGMAFNFVSNQTITGASTLSVSGLAGVPLKKYVNQSLAGCEIQTGQAVAVLYDGTNFQLISPVFPATPAGVPVAIAGTGAGTAQITANWDSAANATGYYIDVATDMAFVNSVPNFTNLNVGNVLNYNITGLSCGTTYYYRVRAANTCGQSSNSNIISYATTSCCTNGWTALASFAGGTARAYASAFSIGSYGYIGVGANNSSVSVNDFWKYDPVANIWTQIAVYPPGNVAFAASFSVGGYGYVGAGTHNWPSSTALSDSFYKYDPGSNVWTPIAVYPIGVSWPVAFSIGNYGYVGVGDQGTPNNVNSFYQYDPTNDTWTAKAAYPGGGGGGVFAAVGFSVGNYGYIGTGLNNTYTAENDMYKYDPTNDTWTAVANYPGGPGNGIWGAVAFGLGNYGYLGTGNNQLNTTAYADFWRYDPVANSWSQKANFPAGATSSPVAYSNGSVGYVGTGASLNNPFYQYCP